MTVVLTNLRADVKEQGPLMRRSSNGFRIDVTADSIIEIPMSFYSLVSLGWSGVFPAITGLLFVKMTGDGGDGEKVPLFFQGAQAAIDLGAAARTVDFDVAAVWDILRIELSAPITTAPTKELYVGFAA